MARFMTLPFAWRQKEYTAFVTIRPMHDDIHYAITLNDSELAALVPEGTLNFYGSDVVQLLDHYTSAPSIDLIHVIVSELLAKHS